MDKANAKLLPAHEAILDTLIALVHAAGPLGAQTDKYVTNTSRIVAAYGDTEVTFAMFMRRRASGEAQGLPGSQACLSSRETQKKPAPKLSPAAPKK